MRLWVRYERASSPSGFCKWNIADPDQAANDTLNRLYLAKSLGMNLVHTVPPGGYAPYTFDAQATAQFKQYLDTAEKLGLYIQYDMRNSFTNLSSVQDQVSRPVAPMWDAVR